MSHLCIYYNQYKNGFKGEKLHLEDVLLIQTWPGFKILENPFFFFFV